MGTLSKLVFKHFIESECERRLFLDLGEDDDRWIVPDASIVPRSARGGGGAALMAMGQRYERQVYDALVRMSTNVVAEAGVRGNYIPSTLSKRGLVGAWESLGAPSGRVCLLEHEFEVPEPWMRRVLGLTDSETVPLLKCPSGMRPDLLLLEPATKWALPALHLLPDGGKATLSEEDAEGKVAIRIIDVKHTHDQQLGPTHFIELIIYAHALSLWLQEQGLDDRFVIPLEGHGILHYHQTLIGLSVDRLEEFVEPLHWRQLAHVYTRIIERIQALRYTPAGALGARARETVPVSIRASCGGCRFLEDCKGSLGMTSEDPGDWDVRLIPYTSRSIGEQLHSLGIHTVRDVVRMLPSHQPSTTPEPLDSERPLVLLKANALARGASLSSNPRYTGGEQHLSVAIPRYSNFELVFDVEADPTQDVVFAAALDLSMSTYHKLSWSKAFNGWWAFWKDALDRRLRESAIDWDSLLGLLNREGISIALGGPNVEAGVRRYGRLFYQALKELLAAEPTRFDIHLADEPGFEGKLRQTAEFRLTWTYAGADPTPDMELELAIVFVERLHQVMTLCHSAEILLQVEATSQWGNTFTQGPNFAGFYWSSEQIKEVENLLERHVAAMIHDARIRDRLLQILDWISPSESAVTHPLQHKKIYDVRTFVETTLGLPRIINYSWHELASDAFSHKYKQRYWTAHFNYIDYARWHEILAEPNVNRRFRYLGDLNMQMKRKVTAVHRLLWRYRDEAKEVIAPGYAYPEKTSNLKPSSDLRAYHGLARVWFTYSRLQASAAELEVDHHLSTYPSWSVGKLFAGRVSNLTRVNDKSLAFTLQGLSSNVKIKPGDWVLLLPNDKREKPSSSLGQWSVVVTNMVWDGSRQCYRVCVEASGYRPHPALESANYDLSSEPWFVFNSSSDVWTGRLLKLLSRRGLGASWLGKRLSLLWTIEAGGALDEPDRSSFSSPEVFAFAPGVLNTEVVANRPLQTTVHPRPDPSQERAIQHALGQAISCLQGPPGTGKSQTIVALIDEFLTRRGETPARILVTSFSYAAMEVVCDKLITSCQADGSAVLAAQQTILFARSSSGTPALATRHSSVRDLEVGSKKLILDGEKLDRRAGKRLENHVGQGFVLVANAHALFHLSELSKSKKNEYELLGNGFGFDLIIVDEASQLPVDHMLASLLLVRPFDVTFEDDVSTWPTESRRQLESVRAVDAPEKPPTRIVLVGDHMQLPPVQPVKPPRKLRRALDSVFSYYVEGHGLKPLQLQVNYRSRPEIVEFTRRLGIYSAVLESFHGENPHLMPPLPAVSDDVGPGWVRRILDPARVVSTLVHERRYETAVSPLEAEVVATLAVAFHRQMRIESAEAERKFWREHLGIVAPHNAHGRLVIRRIIDALTAREGRQTCLTDAELDEALTSTIFSVEKFQGSARSFIIASMGISAIDQLRAEEEFIYDLNRFNVLTSRAQQKMLLVCSRNFLEFTPRDREVLAHAATVRDYALEFCDVEDVITVTNERGQPEPLRFRWHKKEEAAAALGAAPNAQRSALDVLESVRKMVNRTEVIAELGDGGEDHWEEFVRRHDREEVAVSVGPHQSATWIARDQAVRLLEEGLERLEGDPTREEICEAAGLPPAVWSQVEMRLAARGVWPRRP